MSNAFEDQREFEGSEAYSPESQVTARNAFSAEVVDALLDKLSTDDDFRELFQANPRAALHQVGHDTPERHFGLRGTDPVMCLVLSRGLASKDSISAGRDRLKAALTTSGVHNIFMMSTR